jgi:Leucine-rich repeat (LRR) protein
MHKRSTIIRLSSFLTLVIIGCKTEISHNLPEFIDDSIAERRPLINLSTLNSSSRIQTWEEFFEQHGAEDIWNTLKKSKPTLSIDFTTLRTISENSDQQIDSIMQGIMHYLCCTKRSIRNIWVICANKNTDKERAYISPNIGRFIDLRTLNLSANKLTQIPSTISGLINLQHIELSYNQLTQIPDAVYDLKSLATLDLSHNQLTRISEHITKLSNLQKLDVAFNELTKLPDQITELTKLCALDLSHNKITEIPLGFSQLTRLRNLCLDANQLTSLPACILSRSDKLEDYLDVDENCWLDPNSEKLTRTNIQNICRTAYQQFPYSLSVICMQYIEAHLELPGQQELESSLPEELRQAKRRKKLANQTYKWEKGRNIVFFKKVKGSNIPFYLDYPLANHKAAKDMIQKIKDEDLYELNKYTVTDESGEGEKVMAKAKCAKTNRR